MQSNISSLGENWIRTFSEFRLNQDLFFDKRKLTREAFCLDILKVKIICFKLFYGSYYNSL